MKQLLYLVMSLVIVAAITPAVSAWVVGDNYQVSWDLTVGERNVLTRAEANAACQAKWGVNANSIAIYGSPEGCSNASLVASEVSCPTIAISNESTMQFTCAGHGDIARYKDRFVLPNFNATPLIRSEPGQVNFTGSSIYPQNYSYQFGDGASNVGNRTTTHNYGMGLFTVTYRQCAFFYANDCYTITYPNYISVSESNVNFTGTPTNGSAPLSVLFTPQYLVNTTGAFWTFGDGNITAATTTPISHLYQNPGIYTVRLDYYNNSGVSGYVQKNNYITAGAFNATKTKYFQTIDGTNGNIVLNSSIQLKDVENSSWVNATGLTDDGMSSITTLLGHTINAYAQSLGYSDADDLGILNDGQPQYIMMWPTFAKDVSAGNVSLYVTVKDKDTKANIVGAQVAMIPDHGTSQSTATNSAGIAYFIVSNNTMCLISATAQGMGYLAGTTTINTGTSSGGSASAAATILLGRSTTILPTYVPTTLPGQPGVTPGPTPLPGCEDQISPEGQAKCRAAQSNQGLSFLSSNLLGLIQICFVVTILYLLGIKLGK